MTLVYPKCSCSGRYCRLYRINLSLAQHRLFRAETGDSDEERSRQMQAILRNVPMPDEVTRALNFGRAIVRHLAYPIPLPVEQVNQRLAVCRDCAFRSEDWRCRHKGCGCSLPTKAGWATETCPIGLW